MKTEIKEVHTCDYCNKKLFRKWAMEKHEKLCVNNPNNFKVCFGCKYLTRECIDVEFEYKDRYDDYETTIKEVDCFRCTKLDKLMFPFTIEKKRNCIKKYSTYGRSRTYA